MHASEIERLDIKSFFPIDSQTSMPDKAFLLGARSLVQSICGDYAYLEIGSFLGGSLAPFLTDDKCRAVLSVDDRERQQPDARGASYDYAGITAQTMIDTLRGKGLDTAKLRTFDGSIDALPEGERKYQLAFIDGEHTDEACFRDFLWTLRHVADDALVMFHDSTLVFRAIRMIAIYLRNENRPHLLFKRRDSEMTAVAFGAFMQAPLSKYLGEADDLEDFYKRADVKVLSSQIKHRVRLGFDRKRLFGLQVRPPRVLKAY